MKKLSILVLMAFAVSGLMAQNNIDSLFSEYQRRIPYIDTVTQITITKVTPNMKKHHVLFSISLDGERALDNDKNIYLYYLINNPDWDIETLVDNGYSIRIIVNASRTADRTAGAVYITYEFSTDELDAAITTYQAHAFLVRYARNTQAGCPMPADDDSYFVACRYDSLAYEFHLIQEVDNASWGADRAVIANDVEGYTHLQARAIAADTSDAFPLALALTGTTLVHTYRNASRTDSLQIRIAPWMFEEIWKAEENPGAIDELRQNLEFFAFFARNASARCPETIDSITTMTSVVFDTAARLLAHNYSVPELTMLNIQHDPNFVSAISQAIIQNAANAEPGSDAHSFFGIVVQTGVTIRYIYSSPRSKDPVVIEISPEEIAAHLQPQQTGN